MWIGDNYDAEHEYGLRDTTCMLNVADDMRISRTMGGVTYAHVGLVDGPGSPLAAYHAAVLMLHVLLARGDTIVVDPGGTTRPVVVAIMYQHLTRRMGWDHWYNVISGKCRDGFERTIVMGNGEVETITVFGECVLNPAHRAAFDRTNWRLLGSVLEGV